MTVEIAVAEETLVTVKTAMTIDAVETAVTVRRDSSGNRDSRVTVETVETEGTIMVVETAV